MYRDDKLRAAKAIKRMTNKHLAEMTGISRVTISLICGGKAKDVKLSSLISISRALGIQMNELFEPLQRSKNEQQAA